MSPAPQETQEKFDSMTSYLYEGAFEPREDGHQEVCLDCLSQENPWQALRQSQQNLDALLVKEAKNNQKADRKIDTLKLQLFMLTDASQRMDIYNDLHSIAARLKPVKLQAKTLDKTVARLKRINLNQRELLKQLKAGFLGARGQEKQFEVQQRIEDIEWELMSLWQRCIGAELDKLTLLEQSLDCKRQAVELLDKHLDRFCHTRDLEDVS